MLAPYEKTKKDCEELRGFISLAQEEEAFSLEDEIRNDLSLLATEVDQLLFESMLSGEKDSSSAIMSIHAGAGGTDSCDWAQMLLRMYTRWAERKGYKVELVDMLSGEEAGIKSATLSITGDYAFGYSKAEKGVHRLVRISPYDVGGRRHTSFASVDVIPQIEEEEEIEIDEKDLRIDTFRASSAGGQHVNKTDSAVRITHLPTGIIVQCQNERSQHKNKAMAFKLLKAKLYGQKMKEKEAQAQKERAGMGEIAWGSQIRSYVLHPYKLVKDHRTDLEKGNVDEVLDGNIDPFIEAFLKLQLDKEPSITS